MPYRPQRSYAKGLEFQTGMTPMAAMPVLLNFKMREKMVFGSCWSLEDAELMAYAILKKIEQVHDYRRRAAPPALPAPAQPALLAPEPIDDGPGATEA